MPPMNAKSGLAAKYGAKLDSAVQKHAGDETKYGQQRLPGGINNGIAQLKECYFKQVEAGKQNAGEYFFRAMGVVVFPKTVATADGVVTVEGAQTSIIEMVCDTKKKDGSTVTQEEHVANILNEMRKLGADTSNSTAADLEDLAAALAEAQPYFKFSTSETKPTKEYPNPRVFENWHGTQGLEDYVPPEDGGANEGGTDDGSGDVVAAPAPKPAPAPKTAPTKSPTPAPSGSKTPPPKKPAAPAKTPEPPPEEPDPAELDSGDLTTLAERADGGDEKAGGRLTEMAEAAGVSDDEIKAASNWEEVADLIRNAGNPAEESGESDEWTGPEIGNVYYHLPVDPKTKKPAKKKVECEVIDSNTTDKTCSMKDLSNPKVVYRNVSWDTILENNPSD